MALGLTPEHRELAASVRGWAGRHAGPAVVRASAAGTNAVTIGGGTTDIQLNIIAQRILGLPRDPEPAAA